MFTDLCEIYAMMHVDVDWRDFYLNILNDGKFIY